MNKYHAIRTSIDGITFDSRKESRRYLELKLWESTGEISELKCHPSWELVVNGHLIGRYTADFQYILAGGCVVTEDVKSVATRTPSYILRTKLLLALHGIKVVEV